ncbi:MAG TPA: hypothetical protein VLW45_13730 [Pelomicrobium sp.]|nr:hypothetical protein [Pelomicrobium sp.]
MAAVYPPLRKGLTPARAGIAFLAGVIATLVVHQGLWTILHAAGVAPAPPFPMAATNPLDVPKVWSLAFWGGVWGLPLYAFLRKWFPGGASYWVAAMLFGAIAPSLVALFVVLPLHGAPVAGGGNAALIVTALIVNGGWGLGTAFMIRALAR